MSLSPQHPRIPALKGTPRGPSHKAGSAHGCDECWLLCSSCYVSEDNFLTIHQPVSHEPVSHLLYSPRCHGT